MHRLTLIDAVADRDPCGLETFPARLGGRVAELEREELRFVGGLTDEDHVRGDVGGRAIRPHEPERPRPHRAGAVEHAVGVALERGQVIRMHERLESQAHERARPSRDEVAERRVRAGDAAVASDDRHADGAELEPEPQLVLADDERFLGHVTIGDIARDRETGPPSPRTRSTAPRPRPTRGRRASCGAATRPEQTGRGRAGETRP